MADVLINNVLSHDLFSWGAGGTLEKDDDVRKAYLEALRKADKGDYQALLTFARS